MKSSAVKKIEKQQTPAFAGVKSKKQLLSKEVKHIDITSFDARPIIDDMSHMSFTSRDTARGSMPTIRAASRF